MSRKTAISKTYPKRAKPPFDKPQSLIKLFGGSKQKQLAELVNQIKGNAVKVAG